MPAAPDTRRPMHRKALAVIEEIRSLLGECGQTKSTHCLKLEINVNQGIPSRLTYCTETRRDIPLEETR